MSNDSLGAILRSARAAHDLSLQQVAERAGCSAGYVHKLEMDRVTTPSPRVLSRLGEALGLDYRVLTTAIGYPEGESAPPPTIPGAIKRYSNAHIVQLLEDIQTEVRQIHDLIPNTRTT